MDLRRRGDTRSPCPLLPSTITPDGDTGCTVSASPAVSAQALFTGMSNEGGIMLLWPTFRTGATYPQARIQCNRRGDDILWRYYCKHGTFEGAHVYIEPNIHPYSASSERDDYYKEDSRWPTFMSTAEYPWARIQYEPDGDDRLSRYYDRYETYDGAFVDITPNGDNMTHELLLDIRGSLVLLQDERTALDDERRAARGETVPAER